MLQTTEALNQGKPKMGPFCEETVVLIGHFRGVATASHSLVEHRSCLATVLVHRTGASMVMRLALLIAVAGFSGCSGPKFIDLGNGVGVPTESIDAYAKDHGISRKAAKQRMLEESNQNRQPAGAK